IVTPGYLEAMRVPLLRGRLFNEGDIGNRPPVALISESMAKRFWPNEDAIGKRLTLTFFPGIVRQVVGVVRDVKLDELTTSQAAAAIYTPLAQLSLPPSESWRGFDAA